MVRTWSDSPFEPMVADAQLAQGRVLSSGDGESRVVFEIEGHPDWVAKMYKQPLAPQAASTLQRLVYLPTTMQSADREVVDDRVAWPVARVVQGPDVVGVVMAKAPERFSAQLKKPFSEGYSAPEPLILDYLVESEAKTAKRGLAVPDLQVRTRAAVELLEVAALFDAQGIVYGDWSYRNAFWEKGVGSVFLIDLDTCGFGSHAWIESAGWEDPLFPKADRAPLTRDSDSYKVAVLVVRCLTGMRQNPVAALEDLKKSMQNSVLVELLSCGLTAPRPELRPRPAELLAALTQKPANNRNKTRGTANVVGRVNLTDPGRRRRRAGGVSVADASPDVATPPVVVDVPPVVPDPQAVAAPPTAGRPGTSTTANRATADARDVSLSRGEKVAGCTVAVIVLAVLVSLVVWLFWALFGS